MSDMTSGNSLTSSRRLRVHFNQLAYAIAAADHGSFRQAAEALSIKQSTLSRSVQMLEHTFGVAIFERSSGGVRATPFGRNFLRMARSIVEQLEALAIITRTSSRGEAGRLVVGFCTSLSAGNLRATLLDFKSRFPGVELGTIERSRTRLATALRNEVVDVLVTTGDALPVDCKTMRLWSERIFILLPEDHALAEREAVFWTDLRNQTVLLSQYDPGTELEALLNAKLQAGNDRPRIERHDVTRGVIKSLVSMGIGIGLVLESDVDACISTLVYRELRDGTGPSRIGFSAIWREDNENPTLANFLKLLSERYPFLHEA